VIEMSKARIEMVADGLGKLVATKCFDDFDYENIDAINYIAYIGHCYKALSFTGIRYRTYYNENLTEWIAIKGWGN